MKQGTQSDLAGRYVILGSGRIVPKSPIAQVVVWLLDRLPKSVRDDVLGAYWSPEDIRRIEDRASDLEAVFGSASGDRSRK